MIPMSNLYLSAKILNFWDFDGTLIDSPLPDDGKLQWERVKGIKYPALGWWSKTYSLDLEVFDIQPNAPIYDIWKQCATDTNQCNILLTNRIPKLMPQVKEIMAKHSIKMDMLYFADKYNKGERIMNHLSKFGHEQITQINVYEDMEEQIINLESVRKQIEDLSIEYIVHKVQNNDAGRKSGTI